MVYMGGGIGAKAHHIAAPAVAQDVLHLAARPAGVSVCHADIGICTDTEESHDEHINSRRISGAPSSVIASVRTIITKILQQGD